MYWTLSSAKKYAVWVLLLLLTAGAAFWFGSQRPQKSQQTGQRKIYGIGYVRGIGQTTLKNKYAGFVSKVNFYSQQRVKKGDVILEYDDFDIRQKISSKKQELLLQMEDIACQKLELELKRIDPLPSNYRNLNFKYNSARALFKRMKHEEEVYNRLYHVNCVSNLSWQEKKQNALSSEAELKQIEEDQKTIQKGLSALYIKIAEQELRFAEQKSASLKQDLKLLEEERKYYRIVAPYDGLCITNSDTVHGYNAVGTAAAVVHRDSKKLIYAYFQEDDVGLIKENVPCHFRSNQYPDSDVLTEIVPYEVKKERSSYGDRCYFLVKFRVIHEVEPLRIDSTGRVEIIVNERN